MAGHRGVKFVKVGGRMVVRWRDPVSRKVVQKDTAPLGLTNASRRRLWAIEKVKELEKLKADVALAGASLARVTIEKSQGQYLERFANANSKKSKAPSLAALAEFLKERGATDVQDITAPMVAAWGDHVRRPANPHAVGTRNLYLLASGAWLRWCRATGSLPRVTDEQTRNLLAMQQGDEDPIEILRPDDVRKVLAACLAHDRAEEPAIAALALVVLGTGLRYSEAEGLLWEEYDAVEKVIRLPAARTKTRRAREITLAQSPSVVDVLNALRLRGGRGRVFPWIERRTAEYERVATMTDYGAPRWTWRVLRATCGSALVCSAGVYGGAGPFMTAKRLGHGLAVSERHYLAAITGLSPTATTIEESFGYEAEARAIVRAVAGVVSGEAVAVGQ